MTNVVTMEKGKVINLVQEPEVFYRIQNKYDRIISVLGGSTQVSQVVNSDIDLIEITRKGLPTSVVSTLSAVLGISMEKMSSLLHISHRTIQRKNSSDLLNVYSSEQILEIADVISRGIEVLDTLDNFTSWLHSDVRALNYAKPLDFLDTSFGTKLVKDILGRIEHGVYS
ncbi:antitoxin Xre-like helix-turn-helix domain-containing protein [uncultured Marixanthomonas sp.]|uniref:type II RES/Xre toxin-antitoxin system antitoxin n=1 Tax=uncultured Marixanthomonas sp. TaxID=757245 RepID=UPI0030DC09A7|tara:strand:+ start:14321 stop:14830 length:510 start_codon:yes stop_codon:yes gene_type:complete